MNAIKTKKYFMYFTVLLTLCLCACAKESIDLDKNVEGANLTKEFCIDLVQKHWDCSKGAISYNWFPAAGWSTSYWNSHTYRCESNSKPDILRSIEGYFDHTWEYVVVPEKSYYKYRTLHVHADFEYSAHYTYIEVYF